MISEQLTPELQPYLVDWLKSMVASQKIACVVDPKLSEKPSSKELKRVLLVALRCVDPDLGHRPRMGEVIHMLEPRDLLLCDVRTSIFLLFFLLNYHHMFHFLNDLYAYHCPYNEG